MQLIGTEKGSAAVLVAWEEIRPLSVTPASILTIAVVERYKIQYPPAQPRTYAEFQSSVTEFRGGSLEHEGRVIAIQGIIIYSDALVVECSNSDDAEIVLADLIEWARSAGFRDPIRPFKKMHSSRLVVKFDLPFEALFRGWQDLQSLMVSAAESRYGNVQPFGLVRVDFRADNRRIANANLFSQFSFERRVNEPYDEHRFVCDAPLTTSEHLALLEKIEALAKAN